MNHLMEKSALLNIKTYDLRRDVLLQCQESVDKGSHIGGAYSALPPMVALYYGGYMNYDVSNPTSHNQDVFILSKGHAIAAMASLYADLGYFPREHLTGSRGYDSLIKGHPGPVIPGVPVATGPLGHGISIACGYALRMKEKNNHNVYALVGDGELQEGSCWEGIMFAGNRRLSNLCLLIDSNSGQSDDPGRLFIGTQNLADTLRSFGFLVYDAYSDTPATILKALEQFVSLDRSPQAVAVICHSHKGIGGFSDVTQKHKSTFTDEVNERERMLINEARANLVDNLSSFDVQVVQEEAEKMGYCYELNTEQHAPALTRKALNITRKPAVKRDKAVHYNEEDGLKLNRSQAYSANDIMKMFMKSIAIDEKVYSVDADLSNVSGLYDGVRATRVDHALNIGIAEASMMCMAEGLAANGCHVWVSTFGPFFDWQAMRRMAVTYQERKEVIESKDGWLTDGHNLDITFLSTASNLDTAVNGATHMSNDDICVFSQVAHLKIIDVSCPQLLLSIAKWIAQGNRGLVYLRVMRNQSEILYPADYQFEYGRGHYLIHAGESSPVIISSGHATLEALTAAQKLKEAGLSASVLDMPSFDQTLLESLIQSERTLVFAEQNNGILFDQFCKMAGRKKLKVNFSNIYQMSTRTKDQSLQFIQSGTYQQLISALNLTADDIADTVKTALDNQ